MFRKVIAVLMLPALAGCAGYKLTPISTDQVRKAHEDSGPEGYIFYAPQAYLLGVLRPDKASELFKAQVSGTPQPDMQEDPKLAGQDPRTTALVAATEAYDFRIVYLPDTTRPYRFTRYEFFAKSELKLVFEDGWKLTGAESKTDSTAALTALVELAKGGVGILGGEATGKGLPGVVLYRIDTGSKPALAQVFP